MQKAAQCLAGITLNWDEILETQLTWNNQIAISADDDQLGLDEHFDLILTDMQFDPNNPDGSLCRRSGRSVHDY
jgi:hypothetical protein